ncbi:MAG: helix-turn-helix transcriptional regulator [Phycisphaerae bacterium]|nr:LuxR C-terminal-related transcriptional regulator [Tepidisphaeraceae bacterium]
MSDLAPRKLRLRDVRNVFRILGEIRELGADPKAWRPHMTARLCKIFHAELVISSEVHARTTPASPDRLRITDIGWGADSDGHTWEIRSERDDETLAAWRLAAGHIPKEPAAGAEVPVRPIKNVYGGKSFVLSQYPLPHINAVDQLGVHRAFGDTPFTGTEHKLIHIFHTELGRFWRREALKKAKDPTSDLPPRLSQTLHELLGGLSEKEIAAKLDLSRHTIHNYVKALHQRFEVSSRGELLAKVGAATKPDFTPKLSISLPKEKGAKAAKE